MDHNMDRLKEKILRWQLLGEQFIENNTNVFIKDIQNNLYFCKIVVVGETKVTVDCHKPDHRAGQRFYLNWLEIIEFEEERENGN